MSSADPRPAGSVSPSHGLLAPISQDGTLFDVSFAPTKYGMLQRGRLIVETEEMMRSYEVKGTHPSFVVPEAHSKIDTHISKKYLPRRN